MGAYTHLLTSLDRQERKAYYNIVAADCESDGLGGELIEGAAYYDGMAAPMYFQTGLEFLDWYLVKEFRGFTCYFHNADYDLRYLLDGLQDYIQRGWRVEIMARKNDSIICLTIRDTHKHYWKIADSYALLPTKLADLAPLAGMPKLDIGLAEGHTYNPATDREYLDRDVIMLYRAVCNFYTIIYDQFGVYPGLTAGGTAMRAFRTTLTTGYFRQRPEVEEFTRKAVFGGMAFLTTTARKTNCTRIDRNASYADAMRHGVPIGSGTYTTVELSDKPGVYHCRVIAPATFPCCGVRNRDGIVWPNGQFTTYMSTVTLELCRKHGYQVDVIDGYVFERIVYPFDEFVAKCEALEQQGGAIKQAIKFMRNSLFGKFLQRAEQKTYLLADQLPESYTPVVDEKTGEIASPLGYIDEHSERAYMMPHWGVWILDHARAALIETIYSIGPAWCYGGDTDSVTADADAVARATVNIGPGYGQWKIEMARGTFKAIAPKVNFGYNVETGQPYQKHKGLPKASVTVAHLEAASNGIPQQIAFRSVHKPLGMLKRGQASYDTATRTLQSLRETRWRVHGDQVLPLVLGKG